MGNTDESPGARSTPNSPWAFPKQTGPGWRQRIGAQKTSAAGLAILGRRLMVRSEDFSGDESGNMGRKSTQFVHSHRSAAGSRRQPQKLQVPDGALQVVNGKVLRMSSSNYGSEGYRFNSYWVRH
jgi:hypothetical protein